MNLLPKSSREFKEKDYWDSFFTKRKKDAFEWYGDYIQLCPILHKYIQKKDDVLVVGCGNSQLSADLYDVGIEKITNIDISNIVIRQMVEKHSKQRVKMKWLPMDATKMEFGDGQFSAVLDKGTVDALMTDSDEEAVRRVDEMLQEIERVLKFGGRFVCISLLQQHVLHKLLDWFSSSGCWMARICKRFNDSSQVGKSSAGKMEFPVFAIVFTKLKQMIGLEPILEAALYSEIPRKSNIFEVKEGVRALQQFAFLKYHMSKSTLAGEGVSFDLCVEGNPVPRYSLYVVDWVKGDSEKRFAIFIVPQGRETEWLFGSSGGRQQLAESARFQRLVVVHLIRNHHFDSMDTIKAELSSRIMELAPPGLNPKSTIPFLSVGESLGHRNVLYSGTSELSGDFIIEDVEGDNRQIFRRLVFLNSPNITQSEARMIPEKQNKKKGKKKKNKKLIVDPHFLACQHHGFMVAGQAFLLPRIQHDSYCDHLLVGLGGGGLPSFLHQIFINANIDVVELDSCIVSIAEEWFGFCPDDRLKVIVDDGLRFILQAKSASYDVVMLDVDSKDTSVGMSCPPRSFVETEVLLAIKRILTERGVFVLNLVCRDPQLRQDVMCAMCEVFPKCYSYKIQDEVNEIVYGLADVGTNEETELIPLLRQNLKLLNDTFKVRSGNVTVDLIEVDEMTKELRHVL